jgi:hypothetical protein
MRKSRTQARRSVREPPAAAGCAAARSIGAVRSGLRPEALSANGPMPEGQEDPRGGPTSCRLKGVSIDGRNTNSPNKNGLFSMDSWCRVDSHPIVLWREPDPPRQPIL